MIREINFLWFVCRIGSVIFIHTFTMHIGSENWRFSRINSESNMFIKLSNKILKRIQKQGNKNRCIRSMLNKILGRQFNVFNFFEDTADKLLELLSLHWNGAVHTNYCFCSCFFCFFFKFVWLHDGYDTINTLPFRFYFVSIFSIFCICFVFVLCTDFFYFNCFVETIILHIHDRFFFFLIFIYLYI